MRVCSEFSTHYIVWLHYRLLQKPEKTRVIIIIWPRIIHPTYHSDIKLLSLLKVKVKVKYIDCLTHSHQWHGTAYRSRSHRWTIPSKSLTIPIHITNYSLQYWILYYDWWVLSLSMLRGMYYDVSTVVYNTTHMTHHRHHQIWPIFIALMTSTVLLKTCQQAPTYELRLVSFSIASSPHHLHLLIALSVKNGLKNTHFAVFSSLDCCLQSTAQSMGWSLRTVL